MSQCQDNLLGWACARAVKAAEVFGDSPLNVWTNGTPSSSARTVPCRRKEVSPRQCWAVFKILAGQDLSWCPSTEPFLALPHSLPPWRRNLPGKPPVTLRQITGLEGLQDLPVLSPGHVPCVLVTHQSGVPSLSSARRGGPGWGGGTGRATSEGRWPRRATPSAAGDFQGAAGKQDVGKGVMKAGVSMWVKRDPRRSVAIPTES